MSTPISERRLIDCGPNCQDRKPGCHGKCERYKTQRERLTMLKEQDRQRQVGYYYAIESAAKRADNRRKINKNKRGMRWPEG